MVEWLSQGEEETVAAAAELAASLRGQERLALAGELGAGKTTFVRGLAEGLGIDPELVRSPSFVTAVEYPGGRLPLVHIDLFRYGAAEVDEAAMREFLYGPGVCVVEWFDRLGALIEDFLEIEFTIVGPEIRRIVARARGPGYDRLLEAWRGLPGALCLETTDDR